MFTGLVEGQGRIASVEHRAGDLLFRFIPLFSWEKPSIGESVACNGVCLTMETWSPSGPSFTAFASAETVSCTNLGHLSKGMLVNMERAMRLGDRFGGHIVSGHVDTVATVAAIGEVGMSRRIRLEFDEKWSGQIVPKGSVTLDGISLTVNDCGPGYLEVNIIPETWKVTTAANWIPGCRVNLETDVIGKYAAQLAIPYSHTESKPSSAITMEMLLRNGF